MKEVKSEEDYQEMLKSDKVILLDIYAEWCGPCKSMNPVLDEIEEKHNGDVEVYKMDADNDAISSVLQAFNVRSIPTFVFIKNGEVKATAIGANTISAMEDKLKNIL